ncbi:MAG: ATP synthase F1 subunit delta [Fimbriimonas sp.]
MEDKRVGRRYAQALFTAATNLDVVGSVESDLALIVGLFENDPRFRHFVYAPYAGSDEKLAIVDRIFSDRVTALTMQFLRVLLDKRRELEIPSIYHSYVELRRQAQNAVHVVVTSATEMTEDQRSRLLAKLQQQLNTTVEADFKVDPRIVGGVRVAFGNSVLDGSVRGALNRLRERLKYDLLKQA